jgi:hypothetical protein
MICNCTDNVTWGLGCVLMWSRPLSAAASVSAASASAAAAAAAAVAVAVGVRDL